MRLSKRVSHMLFENACNTVCVQFLLSIFQERIYLAVVLPEVNYNKETAVIVVNPKNKKTFTVRTLPVSTSFAIFEKSVLIYCIGFICN